MVDTSLVVFNASAQSAYIDMRTESTNLDGRQVVVFGDPSVNVAVAGVRSQDPGPSATDYGVVMRLAGSATVTGTLTGITNSIAVYFDRGNPAINLTSGTLTNITNTVAVYFDRANPNVTANAGTGTFNVSLDPGHEIGFFQKSRSSSATYNKVEIATVARQIVASNVNRKSISLVHDNTGTMYIGFSSAVTSANVGTGFPLVANQIFVIDDYTGAVFGVLEANPSNVKYIEI